MNNAILTEAGAKRIGHPELCGCTVQYDKVRELGLCVESVYYNGERISGVLSITGEDAGLILQDS